MSEFDTEAVAETMLSDNDQKLEKRGPGRPRLTEEEKAARKAEREAARANDKSPARGRGRGRPPGRKDLPLIEETIGQYVTLIGVGLGSLPNPKFQADGIVIVQQSEAFSHAWCELAKTDTRVYNALRKLCVGGAWGGVVIASASIVMPIAANHGFVPEIVGNLFAAATEDTRSEDELIAAYSDYGKDNGNGSEANTEVPTETS